MSGQFHVNIVDVPDGINAISHAAISLVESRSKQDSVWQDFVDWWMAKHVGCFCYKLKATRVKQANDIASAESITDLKPLES